MTLARVSSEPSTPSTPPTPDVLGVWVLHISGDRFGDHVQLLTVDTQPSVTWPLTFQATAIREWNGTSADLAPSWANGRVDKTSVEWHVALPDGTRIEMYWTVSGDSMRGIFKPVGTDTVHGDSLFGVRISPNRLWPVYGSVSVSAPPRLTNPILDSNPQLLLRVDDIPVSDRSFIERLQQRSLVAELAVPTGRVGAQGRPSWSELQAWVVSGFTVAAHSRTHGQSPKTDLAFFSEVLGSIQDLRSHGLITSVFVQPGTWSDSMNFNTSIKLRSWRGSLLRAFVEFFEGYVYPPPILQPAPDSISFGVGHITLSDGMSNQDILKVWTRALQPRRFTIFLVHTLNLSRPDQLDWFLDSLAVARANGRIRLASSVEALRTH